jgi:hypothetical protein
MEMLLDKIRVSESTKTASKTPCSRRWVYQCRCLFALASGYDWSSLGGEGKITWTVITNKSGVENKRNSVQRSDFSWWIFALWLRRKFEEIGKIRFNSVNLRKKMLNKWKKLTKFTNHKIEKKKRKEKTLIIFVSGIPGTNISLDQTSIYTGTKLQRLWVCF